MTGSEPVTSQADLTLACPSVPERGGGQSPDRSVSGMTGSEPGTSLSATGDRGDDPDSRLLADGCRQVMGALTVDVDVHE